MIAIVAGPPCSTKRLPQTLRRLQRGDRLLGELEQPPLGSHLITPRRGFAHHGIYVGGSKVVHYKSVVCHLRRLPVAEVSLANFAQGRAIWVRGHGQPRFDGTEVTRRARSRLGEDRYRILSNNCEHFCEWCLRDDHRSYQLESLLALPRRLASVCGDAIARLFADDNGTLGRLMHVTCARTRTASWRPNAGCRSRGRDGECRGCGRASERDAGLGSSLCGRVRGADTSPSASGSASGSRLWSPPILDASSVARWSRGSRQWRTISSCIRARR